MGQRHRSRLVGVGRTEQRELRQRRRMLALSFNHCRSGVAVAPGSVLLHSFLAPTAGHPSRSQHFATAPQPTANEFPAGTCQAMANQARWENIVELFARVAASPAKTDWGSCADTLQLSEVRNSLAVFYSDWTLESSEAAALLDIAVRRSRGYLPCQELRSCVVCVCSRLLFLQTPPIARRHLCFPVRLFSMPKLRIHQI